MKTACLHCDLLIDLPSLDYRHSARCPRCAEHLMTHNRHSVQQAGAFSVTALVSFFLSLSFPFITLSAQGQQQVMYLGQAMLDVWRSGYPFLAIILSLCILVIPLFQLLMMLRVYGFLLFPFLSAPKSLVVKSIHYLQAWNMVEVFLIGTLVSLVKIISLAEVSLGIGFWSYACFSLSMILAMLSCDRMMLWKKFSLRLDTGRALRANDDEVSVHG